MDGPNNRNSAGSGLPGDLYHRQRPPARSRIAESQPVVENLRTETSADTAPRMVGMAIRNFILVAACMGALLFMATIIARKMLERETVDIFVTDAAPEPYFPPRQAPTPTAIANVFDPMTLALNPYELSDEAIQRYTDALLIARLFPNPWHLAGKYYLRDKDYSAARRCLELAAASQPETAELLNDLAVSHLFQRQIPPARSLLETALTLDPQFAPAHFNLGLCAAAAGNRAAARMHFQRFRELRPDDARALKEIAALDTAAGDLASALSQLQTALRINSRWADLYFEAAALSAALGQTTNALAYLEKTLDLAAPATIYRVYKNPVFKTLQLTEDGRAFELKLARKARENLAAGRPAAGGSLPGDPIY
jgi:tetratricopeptide (TPR) repeat protein